MVSSFSFRTPNSSNVIAFTTLSLNHSNFDDAAGFSDNDFILSILLDVNLSAFRDGLVIQCERVENDKECWSSSSMGPQEYHENQRQFSSGSQYGGHGGSDNSVWMMCGGKDGAGENGRPKRVFGL